MAKAKKIEEVKEAEKVEKVVVPPDAPKETVDSSPTVVVKAEEPKVTPFPEAPKLDSKLSSNAELVFAVIYLLYKTNTITRYQLASSLKLIKEGMPEDIVTWLIQETRKLQL